MSHRSLTKTHGAHFYRGRRPSRACRLMSKIHRGIRPSRTIGETFKKIGEKNGQICRNEKICRSANKNI